MMEIRGLILNSSVHGCMHFELIFVKNIWSVSRFIFLHVDVQLFWHHLLKDYLFFIVLSLLLCHRTVAGTSRL